MEGIKHYQEKLNNAEKFELNSKVLRQLVLWGFLAFNPMDAIAQNHDINLNSSNETSDIVNRSSEVSNKAIAIEKRLTNEGMINIENKSDKPVVFVTTRDEIESIFLKTGTPTFNKEHELSEIIEAGLLGSGESRLAERSSNFIDYINTEKKLVDSGEIEKDVVSFGNITPINYYVVSSIEGKILVNEIIKMSDGSSTMVSIESNDNDIKNSAKALSMKTIETIQKLESNK